MSIVKSSGGGAALPGTVSLFNREDVPTGYTPITGVAVPSHLYRQPRVTLVEDPLAGSSLAGHWLTDYASNEHVYLLHGTTLRRFNPLTGETEVLAACPVTPGYAVSTLRGIYAYAATQGVAAGSVGKLIYHYDLTSAAWTQVVTLPVARVAGGAVYVPAEDAVYILGGAISTAVSTSSNLLGTVAVHHLGSNTVTTAPWSVAAGHSYKAVRAGGNRLFVYGGSTEACALLDPLTGEQTSVTTELSTTTIRSAAALERPDGSVLLVSTAGDILQLAPGETALLRTAGVSPSAVRTPSASYSATTAVTNASQTTTLRDDLMLCTSSTALGVCSLSALDKAPRGKLFFARKD